MKRFIISCSVLLFAFFILHVSEGQIIHVPAGQPTIQAGIDAAADGDTVLVDPGTYFENINFNGKNITVASLFLTSQDSCYISQTIIDGNQSGSVVTFENGEDQTALLCGFTLTNGYALSGGGIIIYLSSPVIDHVIIHSNTAYGTGLTYGGGGINIYRFSYSTIRNSIITDNHSSYDGGGISCYFYCGIRLENVTVSYNTASGIGGGIFSGASSIQFDPVNRCNIYLNDAPFAVDLYYQGILKKDFYRNGIFDEIEDSLDQLLLPVPETETIVLDTFTVLNPTAFHAYGNYVNAFDILHGKIEQPDADLFVSPFGDDNNNGLTPESPLQTIHQAFRIIRADSTHRNTVQIMEGTYSPTSNNETFPVSLPDYVNISGYEEEEVIFDAEHASGVIIIGGTNIISDLSLINGSGYGGVICTGKPVLQNLVISNNENGAIYCYDGASVNISNTTISNNMVQGYGAGIYCVYADVTLDSVTIKKNISYGEGGGIYCGPYAHMALKNVDITGNKAKKGGGIYCDETNMEIINVTIKDNSATGDEFDDGYGGGLYSGNSDVTMQNVVISNNIAIGDHGTWGFGGGMFCSYSSPIMQNVTICNNYAESYGGGIYTHNSSSPVFSQTNRCNIYLNKAKAGNDLSSDTYLEVIVDTFTVLYPIEYHAMPYENFSFDILHGKIEQYDADLFVSPDGDDLNSGLTQDDPLKTIQFAQSIILFDTLSPNTIHLSEGKYATSTTGEHFPIKVLPYIYIIGSSKQDVIIDSEGQENSFEFHNNDHSRLSGLTVTGSYGQAVYCRNSSPGVFDLEIINNYGAGIGCYNSSPIIQDVSITDNEGSGIYCDASNPELKDVIISGNASVNGGGIFCKTGSGPLLQNVMLINNSAENGGGIYCIGSSNPLIYNSTVRGNSVTKKGGGIFIDFSNPIMSNVELSNNSAKEGGAIYLRGSDSKSLSNLALMSNIATESGGAIYSFHSNFTMTNSLIANNLSYDGGAIYCAALSYPVLINITIAGNTSERGGALFLYRSAGPSLINSVLWDNNPNEVNFSEEGEPNSVTASWSDIQGGESGIVMNNNGTINWLEGNIDQEPLFSGSSEFPFALSYGSPCIDAGTPDTTGFVLPFNDLAGNPRIWNDQIDMGAYEWNSLGLPEVLGQWSMVNGQNYPNPFRDMTTIKFYLNEENMVVLRIFDLCGREIESIDLGHQEKGEHNFIYHAGKLQVGIYLYRLTAGNDCLTREMLVER